MEYSTLLNQGSQEAAEVEGSMGSNLTAAAAVVDSSLSVVTDELTVSISSG